MLVSLVYCNSYRRVKSTISFPALLYLATGGKSLGYFFFNDLRRYQTTFDLQRNVRKYFYPPEGKMPGTKVQVHLDETEAIKNKSRVLMYLTGSPSVDYLDTNEFLPGALADHRGPRLGRLRCLREGRRGHCHQNESCNQAAHVRQGITAP